MMKDGTVVDSLFCCQDRELCVFSDCSEKEFIIERDNTDFSLVVIVLDASALLFDEHQYIVDLQGHLCNLDVEVASHDAPPLMKDGRLYVACSIGG